MQNNSHRKCGQALQSFSSYTDSSVNFVGGSSTRQSRHLDPDPVHSGSKPQVPLIRHLPSVKPETPLTKLASKATKVKSISNSLNVMMIRRQLIGITWNFELFSTVLSLNFCRRHKKHRQQWFATKVWSMRPFWRAKAAPWPQLRQKSFA